MATPNKGSGLFGGGKAKTEVEKAKEASAPAPVDVEEDTKSVLDELEEDEEFMEPQTEVVPDNNIVIKDGQIVSESRATEVQVAAVQNVATRVFTPVDQSSPPKSQALRRVIPRVTKNFRIGPNNYSLIEGVAVNVPADAVLHMRQKNII